MKKTIYRTVIQLTVLSEKPLPEGMSLDEIEANCEDGDFCGKVDHIKTNEPLEGLRAAIAVEDTGSMPQFFQMDREGNVIDDIITGDAF
jgi:hypothetical protein